jgi:hypothetical protein
MFGVYAVRLLFASSVLAPWLLVCLLTKCGLSLRAWIPWLRGIGIFMLACSIICFILDYGRLGRELSAYVWSFWLPSNWLFNRHKKAPSAVITPPTISGRESAKS